jgi:hypothetical protein
VLAFLQTLESIDLSIVYETGVLHSAVRMLGCTIMQPNRNRIGLEHEVQEYSTTAYREGWAVSVDSIIDCSVLQCLPVVFGSLIVVGLTRKGGGW